MITQVTPLPWWYVRWRPIVLTAGCVLGVLYVVALTALIVYQSKLIFPVPVSTSQRNPSSVRLRFDDLYLPVNGGEKIHAWWIPAVGPSSQVILYFHGNAEVLEDEVDNELEILHRTGANLLPVDYRGFGRSSPLRTSGRTTAEDARAAMRYLREQQHIQSKNIVICGWSIGTGVATQLALETPDAGRLVLVSPITNVYDVANQVWLFRYPLRPAQWFPRGNAFDNQAKIASIHMPVLLISGSVDPIAAPWMARRLYDRANQPKILRVIEGGSHNDIFVVGERTIVSEMQGFLERVTRP